MGRLLSSFPSLADSPAMANGAVYVIVMTALLAVVSLATRLSDLARIARKKAIMASETVKNAEKTTKEHSSLKLAWHRFSLTHGPPPTPSEFGTSLGTFEAVQLAVLLFVNLMLMLFPIEWDDSQLWNLAAVGNRIAWVGMGNGFWIFMTATRTSLLTLLTGLPFERNLLYHRWFGYLIGLQITLHVALHMAYFASFDQLATQMAVRTNIYGAVGWAALVLLVGFSLPVVRRKVFQLFKYIHFLFLVFLIFGCLHVPVMAWFFGLGVGLWAVDRVLRFWRSRQDVEVLDLVPLNAGKRSAAVKVVLKVGYGRPRHFEAGQYAFITAPRLATYLNYHPITVMASPDLVGNSGVSHLLDENFTSQFQYADGTTPDGTIVSLCIKVFGGFSGDLYEAAAPNGKPVSDGKEEDMELSFAKNDAPNHLESASVLPRDLQLWSVDAFYGSALVDFADYPAIVLLGGGIGITPMIAIARDLAARMCLPLRIDRADGQDVPTLALAAKDLYFNWWTNSADEYAWLRKEMKAILKLAGKAREFGNRVHVNVMITRQEAFDLEAAGYDEAERAAIFFGMKGQKEIFGEVKKNHPAGDVAVAVCGPAGMVRETRNVCAGEVSDAKGKFDVHWESFEF